MAENRRTWVLCSTLCIIIMELNNLVLNFRVTIFHSKVILATALCKKTAQPLSKYCLLLSVLQFLQEIPPIRVVIWSDLKLMNMETISNHVPMPVVGMRRQMDQVTTASGKGSLQLDITCTKKSSSNKMTFVDAIHACSGRRMSLLSPSDKRKLTSLQLGFPIYCKMSLI